MKTYILYHDQCADGFGAALAAWLLYGNDANYIPVNYGKPVPEMEPHSRVYIVDFSYPADVLLKLASTNTSVTVLDHHATAEKDLSVDRFIEAGIESKNIYYEKFGFMIVGNLRIKFDMNKSGAMLAWEHFHPNANAPKLIQYLQDRDMWWFKLPNSRAVSAYMQTITMDFELWEHVMEELESEAGLREIYAAGAACLKLKQQSVDIMAKNHRSVTLDGKYNTVLFHNYTNGFGILIVEDGIDTMWCAPVANATIFFSEVGEKLLEMYPSAPFAAYYLDRADGKRQWGLRSRPTFDCSVVAKAFGGGGHKQAAGFTQSL